MLTFIEKKSQFISPSSLALVILIWMSEDQDCRTVIKVYSNLAKCAPYMVCVVCTDMWAHRDCTIKASNCKFVMIDQIMWAPTPYKNYIVDTITKNVTLYLEPCIRLAYIRWTNVVTPAKREMKYWEILGFLLNTCNYIAICLHGSTAQHTQN